jgi:quinol monooxygenase YgiN
VIRRRALVLGPAGLLLRGDSMERFAMCAKLVAKPGQRDKIVEYLLEAARLLNPLETCALYVVSTMPAEADAVWVMEIWRSEADHDASLKMESVRALIAKAMPLIAAGGSSIRLTPVGGKGLT